MKMLIIEGQPCLTISRSMVERANALVQVEKLRAGRLNISVSPDIGEYLTIILAGQIAGNEQKYKTELAEIEAGRALRYGVRA
jgi:hypothetical protein